MSKISIGGRMSGKSFFDEELTPLEAFECIIVDLTPHLQEANKEEIKIIETALKRLEQIEINQTIFENNPITVGKKIRALEIIKEKGNFISLEYDEYNGKYYIYDNELYMHNEITKEEYDLLKEVLS